MTNDFKNPWENMDEEIEKKDRSIRTVLLKMTNFVKVIKVIIKKIKKIRIIKVVITLTGNHFCRVNCLELKILL